MKKVIVYFRNADAEADFVEAAKLTNPNLDRSSFSFKKVEAEFSTMDELHNWVVEELNKHPIAEDFVLTAEHIRVYRKVRGDLIDKYDDGSILVLDEGATYFALEVFETTPTDVYRTVALEQMEPAVFCLPKKRAHTTVSPLFTAAMNLTKGEYKFTWHCWEAEQPKIHGISVFAKDVEKLFCEEDENPESVDEKQNPFVTTKEETGRHKNPVERYAKLVVNRHGREDVEDSHKGYGILISKFSHDKVAPRKYVRK